MLPGWLLALSLASLALHVLPSFALRLVIFDFFRNRTLGCVMFEGPRVVTTTGAGALVAFSYGWAAKNQYLDCVQQFSICQ